jgi:hypothetical protein
MIRPDSKYSHYMLFIHHYIISQRESTFLRYFKDLPTQLIIINITYRKYTQITLTHPIGFPYAHHGNLAHNDTIDNMHKRMLFHIVFSLLKK